jgi:hypothetical protein
MWRVEQIDEHLKLKAEINQLRDAANRYLDNDGSRGRYSALELDEARRALEELLDALHEATPSRRSNAEREQFRALTPVSSRRIVRSSYEAASGPAVKGGFS